MMRKCLHNYRKIGSKRLSRFSGDQSRYSGLRSALGKIQRSRHALEIASAGGRSDPYIRESPLRNRRQLRANGIA